MLTEPAFCPHNLNKYASLMTTGNGYMGIRASHEEAYTLQTRGMYLAGLYHRAGKGEINELVNLPDVVGVEISLNGEIFRSPAALSKAGNVNWILPVGNYAACLPGVRLAGRVLPLRAGDLSRHKNCRCLLWKLSSCHWMAMPALVSRPELTPR